MGAGRPSEAAGADRLPRDGHLRHSGAFARTERYRTTTSVDDWGPGEVGFVMAITKMLIF